MTSAENTAVVNAAAIERPRIGYVDGLRALACLWVLAHHALESSGHLALLHAPIVGPLLGSLYYGQFPVMVFLVISGFCLYYPLARRNPVAPCMTLTYAAFIQRRARRIYPPYLATGVGCVLLIAAVPAMRALGADELWRHVFPVDASTILVHAAMLHNVIPGHFSRIDYPMWSIGLEWQLYMLFPILVLALRRYRPWHVAAGVLAISIGCYTISRHTGPLLSSAFRNGPLAYLPVFCAGMITAGITAGGKLRTPSWLLGLGAVAGFGVVRAGSGNGLVHDLATTCGTVCLLLLACKPRSTVARVLSAPWLVSAGIFSYSVYLIHAPIVHLLVRMFGLAGLRDDGLFAALLFAGTPAIVLISYGFHVVFERPFMRPSSSRSPAPTIEVGGVRVLGHVDDEEAVAGPVPVQ